MHTLYKHLENDLTLGLRAWRRSRLQRGLAISLLGLVCLFALVFLAAPAWLAFPALWWTLVGVGTLGWMILTAQYLILPLRHRPTLTQVARHIEEQNPDLEDRLATAVEFGRQAPVSSRIKKNVEAPPSNSHALLQRLLQDAINNTTKIDFPEQLQIRFARLWRTLATIATVLAIVVIFGGSGALRQRLQQFYTAVQNVPKILRGLEVSPGNARVRRGENVEIVAQTPEAVATKASIYFVTGSRAPLTANKLPQEAAWAANVMETTTTLGKFLYRFFEVQDTLQYYVRVGDEFSPIYSIIPLETPEIKDIRLTYHFPAAIGSASRRETGSGDVYAPAGTNVDLEIVASQRLSRAEWQFGENLTRPMQIFADTLARVSFAVEKEGYYAVRLTNTDGMSNTSVEYFVHIMPDEAPQITIERPGRDARPTMLEEVPVAVHVSDDYGLKQFELVYSINDQPAVREDLLAAMKRDRDNPNNRLNYHGERMLFLEDLGVQPGDFISYYFEAVDAKQKTGTDLYFLEVRPFDEEFYRALSQGGGGENSPGLAVSQKEIITATWKLERARQKLSDEEVKKSSKALAETQASLQESVLRIAQAAGMRGNIGGEGSAKITEYLEQAAAVMSEAVPLLEEARLAEALDPERRAYQFLLKADAEMRRRELAMNSGQASSFGQLQSSEEFSRVFQDELNKIQSKYETLQNQQQQQQETQLNEALQKVKELAQRQERLNELNRSMQRENQLAEEKKRQIERLRRQQEELNREAQNLARQMQQLGQSAGANQQSLQQLEETLRQAADDMKRTTDNLRRENLANAGAEGNRALDRLRRLEDQLQQQRSSSLRENLAQLRDEVQRLAEAQSQLSDELQRQSGAAGAEQRQQWGERQQELQRRAARTREDLEKTRQAAANSSNEERVERSREKRQLAQDLRKLTQEFDQRRITERMQEAGEAIQQEKFDEAGRAQRETAQNLKRLEAKLGESLSQLAEAPDEKLDVALQETQRLRRDLEESWRERGERSEAGSPEQPQGGNRSGQQNQNPQFAPNGSPSGGMPSDQRLRPEEMNWWSERMWQGLRDLEKISPFLRADTALADDYARLMQSYRGAVRTFRGGDPLRRDQIEKQLLDPLRRFEAELATRLAVLQNQQQMLTARDEPVPAQYREMVDKYFEMLSKKR
ncbi:MAG: hypothetical protein ONB46_02050 [candidate division KSB1 bacterium]|nr:hypothetical protein [candidate division KSB1 bacterium]MDZ7364451.1 hypothetical protein [candidate division KSB1 bacterium]MDZ7402823.1 hypothetical protein [candidate division KSB1 bacterium]